ncbi:group II intron maturase-specific domain-containing protein [Streptomyces sp. NPDC094438]|uniref:group II intron maturase-specific domain-containing protein n=1 Tax=Streptomyces sp. NPDC094438 TaxID=3366061 RepID=UPI0037F65569
MATEEPISNRSWRRGPRRSTSQRPAAWCAAGFRTSPGLGGGSRRSGTLLRLQRAEKKISTEIRSWRLHRQIHLIFFDLARRLNPIVRGWMQYYGAFYRSALHPLLQRINAYLMRWVRKKYRRLRSFKRAHACWKRVTRQYPRLFAQWAWTPGFT